MTRESSESVTTTVVEPGRMIFDSEGTALGVVEGCSDGRFTVQTIDGVETAGENPDEESVPGGVVGEGYLMWRCVECGEVGDLEDGLPESCPNCDAPPVAITKAIED